jgi:hypothetical protein
LSPPKITGFGGPTISTSRFSPDKLRPPEKSISVSRR